MENSREGGRVNTRLLHHLFLPLMCGDLFGVDGVKCLSEWEDGEIILHVYRTDIVMCSRTFV